MRRWRLWGASTERSRPLCLVRLRVSRVTQLELCLAGNNTSTLSDTGWRDDCSPWPTSNRKAMDLLVAFDSKDASRSGNTQCNGVHSKIEQLDLRTGINADHGGWCPDAWVSRTERLLVPEPQQWILNNPISYLKAQKPR